MWLNVSRAERGVCKVNVRVLGGELLTQQLNLGFSPLKDLVHPNTKKEELKLKWEKERKKESAIEVGAGVASSCTKM